jgi:epoxide hydrolase-like predicted phosphatase
MQTIKAFIFDFGGVLYRNPELHWMRRWTSLLGLNDDPVVNALLAEPEESPYVMDLMLGKISEDDIWQIAADRYHVSEAVARRIRRGVLSKKRKNLPMADFLAGLRPQYKTAILSNASTNARQMFAEVMNIDQLVDIIIISAEEGLIKPDERIYNLALDRLGVSPDEVVFLDDRRVNVEAARRLGINAIQFHNTAQALADLQIYL